MKICFMCDLHLSELDNASQYRVLNWAVKDIKKKNTDCVIFVGDVTCDGNIVTYKQFIENMSGLGIPFLYIPGNSDIRNKEFSAQIAKIASPCMNTINNNLIFAVNDCERTVSEEDISCIEQADGDSIVFMHHPFEVLKDESRLKMFEWRRTHKDTMLFYGHRHIWNVAENCVSLPAMDPDKSIGENAAITYFDTNTKELSKSNFPTAVPKDLVEHFGVSCYEVEEHIKFATENRLKNIELRPNCLNIGQDKLLSLINGWRESGGENLSLHFPDIAFKNGNVILNERFNEYIILTDLLKANRITQHVPKVSLKTVKEGKDVLEKIADKLADGLNSIEQKVIVGIENMHMTSAEAPDENRRFGYIPEECIEFMQILSGRCKHKVGINFDIGHARNNAPYSQKYQISAWFSLIGKYIVGYHLHQVKSENGVFENHTAITDVFGKLISLGSFFDCWEIGQINKAPVILEMRPENAYKTTLAVFKKQLQICK